jgi:Catalytic LigB subunit of aromatic ring-opening dioxygenase
VLRKIIGKRAERFGIIGTGGLSHHPGAPEMGEIDEEFDRKFLEKVERAEVDEIASMSKERIDAAGFGTWEIRQWMVVAGAVPERRGRTLFYEAMHEWDTGCAIALFE